MTHQADGRAAYLPAQSPPENDSAARSSGCRAEIWLRLSLPKSKIVRAIGALTGQVKNALYVIRLREQID
jgi:hypothetical protein